MFDKIVMTNMGHVICLKISSAIVGKQTAGSGGHLSM